MSDLDIINEIKARDINLQLEIKWSFWSLKKKVKQLDISYQEIDVFILEKISTLNHLNRLSLEGTFIHEFPESLCNLDNLECLSLKYNHINMIPECIWKLKNLKILDLSFNKLIDFPKSILQLKNLESLHLGNNEIEVIPAQIYYLNQLMHLDLYENKINEVPESIIKLKNLKELDLNHNLITDMIRYKENLNPYELIDECFSVKEKRLLEHKEIEAKVILDFIRTDKSIIITEGKTDWKHLKKALARLREQGLYTDLNIQFEEYEDIDMGDAEIDRMIQTYSKTKQSKRHIFVLDRDNSKYVNKYGKNKFNNHKNNVYSFCIPKISHELDKICIEFYYQKADIKTEDKFRRRIFLGEEFKGKGDGNSQCGKYVTEKRNAVALDIIDRDKKVFMVEDVEKKDNIALSKNDFTNHIINDVEGFDNFDIENFKLIFDVIEKIVDDV